MQRAERTDPDGIDYGWVMQVTFVLTVVVGAPLVAVVSVGRPLPSWEARVTFAVRVGSLVWILTAVSVYAYARTCRDGEEDVERETDPGNGTPGSVDPGSGNAGDDPTEE
ncbi:peptidoglycan-binding protein [Halobacteriales archaeon QS_8_69_26]|nr:MAG: peptidoglycan-binding protein [Halobacteriales archaeon QS_8_69_26]